MISDVTARKEAEENAKAALLEKETMLKEIHHRVKNNLQIISSLLNIQSSNIQDENARKTLTSSMAWVKTMAMIHTQLYQSSDLATINFGSFIRELAGYIRQLYAVSGSSPAVDIDADETRLDINTAIPCGLILNELVSNALKHAFFGIEDGRITIKLRSQAGLVYLSVQDNGIGLPPEVNIGQNSHSLGLEIVTILSKQINAELKLLSEGGAKWVISFPVRNTEEQQNE